MKRYLCEKLCKARIERNRVKQDELANLPEIKASVERLSVAIDDVSEYFEKQEKIVTEMFIAMISSGVSASDLSPEKIIKVADGLLNALYKDKYMSILEAADSVTDDPDLMHEITKTEAEITNHIHFGEEKETNK